MRNFKWGFQMGILKGMNGVFKSGIVWLFKWGFIMGILNVDKMGMSNGVFECGF